VIGRQQGKLLRVLGLSDGRAGSVTCVITTRWVLNHQSQQTGTVFYGDRAIRIIAMHH
jgi:hypothetical protein